MVKNVREKTAPPSALQLSENEECGSPTVCFGNISSVQCKTRELLILLIGTKCLLEFDLHNYFYLHLNAVSRLRNKICEIVHWVVIMKHLGATL